MDAVDPSQRGELKMSREGWLTALRMLRRFRDTKRGTWARVTWKDGQLRVTINDRAFGMAAVGTWPEAIEVPAEFFRRMVAFPPDEDPINFLLEGDQLTVGPYSVKLPPPVTRQRPRLGARRPGKVLEPITGSLFSSGDEKATPRPVMSDAAERIQRAAELLAPLGIDEEDLRKLLGTQLDLGLIPKSRMSLRKTR